MEMIVRAAWAALALIHVAPAAAFFVPGTLKSLYGVEPDGDVGTLMSHRGSLFLAVVVLCMCAMLDPTARPAASLAVGISVLGFLFVYARAGFPTGALRRIAVADGLALIPLVAVAIDAWRVQTV